MSDQDSDYEEDYEDSEATVSGLQDVEQAIQRVEEAINNKWTTVQFIGMMCVAYLLLSLAGSAWHSKWRYALTYGANLSQVTVDKRPHDCDFLAAPLGGKYCRYEPAVSTIRWAKSTTGNPLVSYDEGKTWSEFTPDAAEKVPQHSTIEVVSVSWNKVEE